MNILDKFLKSMRNLKSFDIYQLQESFLIALMYGMQSLEKNFFSKIIYNKYKSRNTSISNFSYNEHFQPLFLNFPIIELIFYFQ